MNLLQRLEANSTWEPNSGCRIWLGALSREHGVVKVGGKAEAVHRVAWELERGPIPKGLWVLHNCGVGPCFNVNHLRLGTREENAADRRRHGGYLGAPGGGTIAQVRVADSPSPPRTRAEKTQMSHEEVRRILDYDPETGAFRWKARSDRDKSWNHRWVGEEAGSVLQIGYCYINILNKPHLAHRLAWLFMMGAWPARGQQIDHINGDRSDNRWCNLRLATQEQNSANQGIRANNKSGVKGVSWDKKKQMWVAMITKGRVQKFLGYFRTIPEAAAARRAAETEHHGGYARQGDNAA